MSTRLIIDGNSVYEIDEDCEQKRPEGSVTCQNMQESENNSTEETASSDEGNTSQ